MVAYLSEGFGGLLASVGLLIVLGSIIGVALERSGAAGRIAGLILGDGGRPALRLFVLGAVISIPVFCDSGFIILAGLLPALAARSGNRLAPLALSLAGGLYLTHTLIPPTPGPLAAAANLGAEGFVGTQMLVGALVSIPVLLVGWRAALYLGRSVEANPPAPDLETDSPPPGLWLSLLPLLIPILLIGTGSALSLVADIDFWPGNPVIALLLGCIPALLLPARVSRTDWIKDALTLAGPILIITGLGGAFGAILKASTLADDVAGWVGTEALSLTTLVAISFGLAALLKTAQGSSTGALVITSGMIAPLVPLAGLTGGIELSLLTLAIGGGAMTVSHGNDSYFWVVTRFSGIGVGEAYRSYSVLTGVMGGTVFLVVIALSLFC